jgi:hypothetical protein
LAAASCATVVPATAARALRVSPGWTTYCDDEASDVGTSTPEPVSLPAGAPACSEATGVEASDETPASCGGITSCDPVVSSAVAGRPFAVANCSTVKPSVAATDESDSPGSTTCRKAAEAVAGAIMAVAAAREITTAGARTAHGFPVAA